MFSSIPLLALVSSATADSILWDGRLNNYTSAAYLSAWSWSNQVGPYQYYIHGSSAVDSYVVFSPSYANPADTSSKQGIQISIDNTSSWHGQTMMRTELIPSTPSPASISTGQVYYHFSIQHTTTDPPLATSEHQVAFFESHFTELKFGLAGAENLLQWFAGSASHWNTTFEAGVWHNIAYAIDFDAQTVAYWHSTGGDDLALTAGPVSASTESDGADWHLGVLRLAAADGSNEGRESWHFSGVWIESGNLTKTICGK